MSITFQHARVAVTPGGDITPEMIAGYYVLYMIPEHGVSLEKVRKAFAAHGLDESRLPKGRRPEHVMQDACTKAQKIHVNGKRTEVRAEQVSRDANFLTYQLTRHVRDLENNVIDHPKALRVLFSFEDDTLDFQPLDGASMADVQSLAAEIQSYYDANQSIMPGRGLRTILRKYLEDAGAEMIRDGGYFLPTMTRLTQNSKLRAHHGEQIEAAAFIESVQSALREIYGREPDFHPIPCVNDSGQREFLKRRFIENCSQDLKVYRDKCLGMITPDRKRAVKTDTRDAMVAQRRALNERRQQFAEILGETLEELERDMGLADAALSKFLLEA